MAEIFDDLTDVYEATIDWPKRLANEEPFYRWLFERLGAKGILDVACGTGHHAAMFNSWGLTVEGADLSGNMIARARSRFGESSSLRWTIRGFERPIDAPGQFDVAICVGNSLALAPDMQIITAAVHAMLAAVRSGGAILIHVLNLWSLPDGQPVWQKCERATLPQGESLIIKGVHRCGQRGFVNLLVTRLDQDPPKLQSECVPFLGLKTSDLETIALQAGATQIEFFGDYHRRPYNRERSQDLIMVATA